MGKICVYMHMANVLHNANIFSKQKWSSTNPDIGSDLTQENLHGLNDISFKISNIRALFSENQNVRGYGINCRYWCVKKYLRRFAQVIFALTLEPYKIRDQ